MNVVCLVGNLGKDPVVTYFDSGAVNAKFSIAYNQYRKDKENVTHWFDCVAWDKNATNIAEHFKGGDKIGITGELLTESWEKDGQKHKKTLVNVRSFSFVASKKDKDGEAQNSTPATQAKSEPAEPVQQQLTEEEMDEIPF